MRDLLQYLIVITSLLIATAPAHAGIPIPCTGETIVKVLDIDSVPGRKPGIAGLIERPIDLGYKFNGCSGGEWVGYTGEYRHYLALPEPLLKILLLKSGRTEFPPAPSFMWTFSASWVVWMYIVLFTPVLLAGIFGKKPATVPSAPEFPAAANPPVASPATSLIGSTRVSAAPPAAVARPPAAPGPNTTAASARSVSRGPNIQTRLTSTPGFGRRA